TTVVLRPVRAGQACELGDEDERSERDDARVDGDRAERSYRFAGGSASVREARRVELLEADFLAGARTDFGAIAVAFGEAHGRAVGRLAAALHAELVVKVLRDLGDRRAARVEDRGGLVAGAFLRKVVVGVAEEIGLRRLQRRVDHARLAPVVFDR